MKLSQILSLMLLAGLISCGENKKEENQDPMPMQSEMHQPEGMSEGAEDPAEFSNDTIAIAYRQYIIIKDALVKEDIDAVNEAAKKMIEAFGENSRFAEIGTPANRLIGSSNINEQREVFSNLTKAIDPFLKESISSGEIYKQYCPMAFEGRGDYWYSNSQEIRNPYFGDKMLKCGRVDETIN